MHFGTGPGHLDTLTDNDPYILYEHLDEIEICARDSKSIFFLVSLFLELLLCAIWPDVGHFNVIAPCACFECFHDKTQYILL